MEGVRGVTSGAVLIHRRPARMAGRARSGVDLLCDRRTDRNFITRMGGRKRAGRVYLLESECGGNRERGHDQRSPREQREGAARLPIERRIPAEMALAQPPLFQFDRRIGAELSLFAFAFVPEDFQRMLARQTTAKPPRARRTSLPRRRGAAALKLLDPSREDQPGRIEPDRYALAGGFLSACGRILDGRLARGPDPQPIAPPFDFPAQLRPL